MAVLGVQIVTTMIMASVLSKFSSHYSFGRWILCSRLARYLHPSDEELRKLAPPAANRGKSGKKNGHSKKPSDEPFTLPKTVNIQLETAPIKPIDLLPLHFYTEYQWLMDFAVCGMLIYAVTELYYAVVEPVNELNLSMLWCSVMLAFTVKIMFSLTAIYFRTEEGGEKMLCIMFGFFFLVLAMAVLIVDEQMLEFGLEPAYENFSSEAVVFLESQGFESAGPVSLLTVRIILAIVCSILGAFLTFPGLRLAKMHTDALKYTKGNPIIQLLLYVNLILPLFISLTWIRPLFREYLVKRLVYGRHLMDDETFDLVRLGLIVVFCAFRFCLIWQHLQAHLNLAHEKVVSLRREAGRITSVDLKKLIVHVYYYLCVVALQYVTPLIMLLYALLMLKTLGDFSVTDVVGVRLPSLRSENASAASVDAVANVSSTTTDDGDSESASDSIVATATEFSQTLLRMRLVFTPLIFRGLFSFLCWWICTAWFTTSAFGIMYYSYFNV